MQKRILLRTGVAYVATLWIAYNLYLASAAPPNKKVISYCFYGGDSDRYSGGLLANAKVLETVFPGWHMYIYYDKSAAQDKLKAAAAMSKMIHTIDVDATPSLSHLENKMSWRFLPLEDPTVERFIARDCDSRLTPRDKAAVDAWVESGKKFHVVRDHPSHSKHPMSGGMWGAVWGSLPDLQQMLTELHSDASFVDMNFLTDKVWPIAQQSLIQHDAFTCDGFGGGGLPVPHIRQGGEHLGAVYLNGQMRKIDTDILLQAKRPKSCTPPEEFEAWSGSGYVKGERACDCAAYQGGGTYCDMDNSARVATVCMKGCAKRSGGHNGNGVCVSVSAASPTAEPQPPPAPPPRPPAPTTSQAVDTPGGDVAAAAPADSRREAVPTAGVESNNQFTPEVTQNQDSSRPLIAYMMGVTSRGSSAGDMNTQKLAPFNHALPSLVKTASPRFRYLVVLGYDTGDAFYDTAKGWQDVEQWFARHVTPKLKECTLQGVRVDNTLKKPGPVFNAIARVAYKMGANYFYRTNDDTQLTAPWAEEFVSTLDSFGPLYGVVGPAHKGGNEDILTHDFVHRLHMEIFDQTYYPDELVDWWMDDWITHVYGKARTKRMEGSTAIHHVYATRYAVPDPSGVKKLPAALARGKRIIGKYMKDKGLSGADALFENAGCDCAAYQGGGTYCDMDNSARVATVCMKGCAERSGGHNGNGVCVSVSATSQKPVAPPAPVAATSPAKVQSGCKDEMCEAFPLVAGVMAWVSQFDVNQNALLCSEEVRKMPEGAGAFMPRFSRIRQAQGDGRLCLRFSMLEAALFRLSMPELRKASKDFSTVKPLNVNQARSYKFQDIPDYQRKSQWPYVSQEGLEAAATFVFHGKGALVSQVWTPADVMPGDIISVRGPGISAQFWSEVHPHITNPYVLCVQTEAENVTPGVYAGKLQDKTVGVFYVTNRDATTPKHPKLKAMPIGQLWKTDAARLYELALNAPPVLDASRNIEVLILYTVTNHPDRVIAQKAFEKNFAGTSMLHQPAKVDGSIAVLQMYGRTKFVVSPFGAGPDCHRNWEAIAMGAVPIVLSHDGINELFESEPVLIVKQWSDVTPELLKSWQPPARKSTFLWTSHWHNVLETESKRLSATPEIS